MTVQELVKLAAARVYTGREGRPTLEAYCHQVALSLKEAMQQKAYGRPAKYTGKESQKALMGRGDVAVHSPEDLDDYQPEPGDPTGWGAHIVDAVIALACLCRMHQIPLDTALERKLRRFESPIQPEEQE